VTLHGNDVCYDGAMNKFQVIEDIEPRDQSQASLRDQQEILHAAANRLGLYDAADWLWARMQENK
jgi:hypothetical protein